MTVLVDTSVWVDHLRVRNERLATLLEAGRVICHPFILGEIASLTLANRDELLGRLEHLPQANVATQSDVLELIELHRLNGLGLGWVDIHLLASVLLAQCRLWTLDPLLHSAAHELNVSA